MLSKTEAVIGKFVGDKDRKKSGLARAYVAISEAWRDIYGDIPLPTPALTQEIQAPPIDLRQQTFDLLHLVVKPSAEEKEVLEAKKKLVFVPMTSQSYAQVVAEDPDHFWRNELEYAKARPALRDYVPPVEVEVGLIEAQLALPDSFRTPRAVALQMIQDYSQKLQEEFPDFRAIMLPATGYASADRAYAKRKPGQVLFKNYFAWCLDDLSGMSAALAGRDGPSYQFGVGDWGAGSGLDDVGAVPAVVKISTK